MNEAEISDLVRRYQTGDRDAEDRLFAHFAPRLVRVAEQHLSRPVGAREEGADVVQSAFRTFLRRRAEGHFYIDNSSAFWRLLVKITVLKARAKARHHTADKRDVRAEVGDDWLAQAAGREPTPEEAATLSDLIDTLLAGLPADYARLMELSLQG